MYPIQKFVLAVMKNNGISRARLVKGLGYRNTTKGLNMQETAPSESKSPSFHNDSYR